jgi:hypothetical protein
MKTSLGRVSLSMIVVATTVLTLIAFRAEQALAQVNCQEHEGPAQTVRLSLNGETRTIDGVASPVFCLTLDGPAILSSSTTTYTGCGPVCVRSETTVGGAGSARLSVTYLQDGAERSESIYVPSIPLLGPTTSCTAYGTPPPSCAAGGAEEEEPDPSPSASPTSTPTPTQTPSSSPEPEDPSTVVSLTASSENVKKNTTVVLSGSIETSPSCTSARSIQLWADKHPTKERSVDSGTTTSDAAGLFSFTYKVDAPTDLVAVVGATPGCDEGRSATVTITNRKN